jgi:hypothetical protein
MPPSAVTALATTGLVVSDWLFCTRHRIVLATPYG